MTMTDRVLILGELRGLAASPLWDRPTTYEDGLRRMAMDRADALIGGAVVFGWTIAMRHAGPTILADEKAFLLYYPRGGK